MDTLVNVYLDTRVRYASNLLMYAPVILVLTAEHVQLQGQVRNF